MGGIDGGRHEGNLSADAAVVTRGMNCQAAASALTMT